MNKSTPITSYITPMIYYIGSSLLGAGVVAIFLESVQFTELFRKYVFNMIYCPTDDDKIPNEMLTYSWLTITQGKLNRILPNNYVTQAKKLIFDQFFNEKTEYLFKNYRITYELTPSRNNPHIVEVEEYTEAYIILAPHVTNPILTQEFNLKTDTPTIKLWLDSKEVTEPFKEKSNNLYEANIEINSYNPTRKNDIRLEKTSIYKQDLATEPYFMATITRFVKGAEIRIKVNKPKDYQLIFKRLGVRTTAEDDKPVVINCAKHWTIADDNILLLPGQGYIILVLPVCECD